MCLHSHGASVHCVRPLPGCRPGGRPSFFASPKKEGKEGRPRRERSALGADYSVVLGFWGLAPNSLRGLWPLRSDSRAKSVDEARCRARPQTPALLDATHGAQEQYRSLLRNIPSRLASPRRQGAQQPEASTRRCAVRRAVGYLEQVFRGPGLFAGDKSRKEAAEAVQQSGERLCFGYFHLTRQMKVTRPAGARPGAPAGRQKKQLREAGKEQRAQTPKTNTQSRPTRANPR